MIIWLSLALAGGPECIRDVPFADLNCDTIPAFDEQPVDGSDPVCMDVQQNPLDYVQFQVTPRTQVIVEIAFQQREEAIAVVVLPVALLGDREHGLVAHPPPSEG